MDHEGEYASRWATVASISAKIGCSAHTLLDWVKKAEIDSGRKSDFTLDMAASLKPHQHEVRELRQANEILGKASEFFAQAEIIHRRDCGKHSRPSNLQHSNGSIGSINNHLMRPIGEKACRRRGKPLRHAGRTSHGSKS